MSHQPSGEKQEKLAHCEEVAEPPKVSLHLVNMTMDVDVEHTVDIN